MASRLLPYDQDRIPSDPSKLKMETAVHTSSLTTTSAARRHRPPRPGAIVRVADTVLNIADQDDLVRRIIADGEAAVGGAVFTLNLDHLVKLKEDAAFREAYDRALHVTADGTPVVWMARAAGAEIERVTGADLVLPLCRAAAAAGLPIHLFGTAPAALEAAAARIRAEAPGIVVAGMESPPFGFDPVGPAALEAARRIGESGARICFVALGAPKQELFADAAVPAAPGVTFVCIGAALDFLSGAQRRAPRAVQAVGMEWAWRLAHDPKRLFRRYWRSAAYLAGYVATHVAALARRGATNVLRGVARDFRGPDPK